MTINIQEIVNAKIAEMEANKTIETLIDTGIEQALTKGIDSALSDYKFRRNIEEKVAGGLDDALSKLDFTTYNGFVVDTMKTLLNGVVREDLRKRTEDMLSAVFVCDRKSIKVSEIFEAYRAMVIEDTGDHEQYERQHFHAKFKQESGYSWYNAELHPGEVSNWGRPDIKFTVHRRGDGTGWIGSVYLDGVSLSEKMKLGHLNDVELMLVQAAYNKIPVEIDIGDTDEIDNSYDVDL